MFSRRLTHAGHTRSFVVAPVQTSGWDLRVQEDGVVVRHVHYSDWHRVERALVGLEREVRELMQMGWKEAPAASVHSTNR